MGGKPFDAVTAESILSDGVTELPNLNQLSHAEKDDLIRALWAQVPSLTARVAALEARLGEPSKAPDNSSLPPSKGQKPNQPEQARCTGPRRGTWGAKVVAVRWPAIPTKR
jgi:transposase